MNSAEMKNVSIIGAGSFGTSIARVIAEKHPELNIKIWAYEKDVVGSINRVHMNIRFLPDIELPHNVSAYTGYREALSDCMAVIFATPSKVLYDISLKTKKFIPDSAYIGYISKGFCKIHNDIYPISDTLARVFPSHAKKITALYGPSHAEEVSRGYHTCLNVASHSAAARRMFVDLLDGSYLSCRESEDIRGVDLGATLKNPAAIAAGLLSVMPQCGDNLAGALIVEALNEMIKIGNVFKIKQDTLIGISGLGDLVATALSPHSRNRRFGKDIAKQIMSTGTSVSMYDRIIMSFRPEHVLEKMGERFNYLAEGAYAIEPILEIAKKYNISIPVYRALYEVLLNKRDPSLLVETVKNPTKFEEIYEKTKIQVSDRKRGMEKKRGRIFNKRILKNTLDKMLTNQEFIPEILEYKNTFLEEFNKGIGERGKLSKFDNKEYQLFLSMNEQNMAKALAALCNLYIKDISDNFNIFVYKVFIKSIKGYNFFNTLFQRRYNKGIFESNIQISGKPKDIKKISDTKNIVYVSTYRSYFDFAYINMAIDRFGLYIPRFFIERKTVKGLLTRYVLKLMGGYMFDSDRLSNPVYREVFQDYLATLIEHGVHILFFPEIKLSEDGRIGNINHKFLSMIMDALFKNTEEIALIPIAVSYYKKPETDDKQGSATAITIRNILDNVIRIKFSEPIYASDFSNTFNTLELLSENIDAKWKSDSEIFPHYILCRILRDNNYSINIKEAGKYIADSIGSYNLGKRYKARYIMKKGLDFILKNELGSINDGKLVVTKKEEVDYYSNLIY